MGICVDKERKGAMSVNRRVWPKLSRGLTFLFFVPGMLVCVKSVFANPYVCNCGCGPKEYDCVLFPCLSCRAHHTCESAIRWDTAVPFVGPLVGRVELSVWVFLFSLLSVSSILNIKTDVMSQGGERIWRRAVVLAVHPELSGAQRMSPQSIIRTPSVS